MLFVYFSGVIWYINRLKSDSCNTYEKGLLFVKTPFINAIFIMAS